jgi:hypothetical protein
MSLKPKYVTVQHNLDVICSPTLRGWFMLVQLSVCALSNILRLRILIYYSDYKLYGMFTN